MALELLFYLPLALSMAMETANKLRCLASSHLAAFLLFHPTCTFGLTAQVHTLCM